MLPNIPCDAEIGVKGVRNMYNRLVTETILSCRRKGYFQPAEKANASADIAAAQEESRVTPHLVADDQYIDFNGNASLFEEQVCTARDFAGPA